MRLNLSSTVSLLLGPVAIAIAGCGGHVSASNSEVESRLTIQAAATHIDTNRTTRYSATLADGEPANVEWSVSGGDPKAGAGSISRDGIYTPPSYLTRDAVTVEVNAVLAGAGNQSAPPSDKAALTVTPGFLQPLTPGNLSLGPNGTVTVSGSMSEVGGSGEIRFALASDPAGTPSIAGTLSSPHCTRGSVEGSNPAYTVCSVTYSAPASIPVSSSVYILGSVASNPTLSWTRILLNSAGISSNPAAHQVRLAVPVQLGSSSGSNVDYDANLGQLTDCCGGTLGALLQDATGNQFVLSNNHVFARSDQSLLGETIVQPGLIDNGCTPYGVGPGTTPVATLAGYPPLTSPATNVDAAIARVSPGLVDPKGSILELGTKQSDGTLTAAPPGISSTGGKGESASLGMMVAKSGRTTGLTCAAVSAVSVDVVVDYFTDCAETTHSFTKTFTNQIAISGTNFSDAGDSGALVVDTANAEPVGLFFAGATDSNGVEHAIASPAADVLASLDSEVPENASAASYTFVGGADHPVSCLSYDGASGPMEGKSTEAYGAPALTAAEKERAEAALVQAQLLVNPSIGIVRTGLAASRDYPGAAAVAFYLDASANPQAALSIPSSIGGVATVLLPANSGEATPTNTTLPSPPQPRSASLNQALAVKQRIAAVLLKSNPSLFGVGVGQSLDDPEEAALILFADRKGINTNLPQSIDNVRVRVILMDRLHVTRSHGTPLESRSHNSGSCASTKHLGGTPERENSPLDREPSLLEDRLNLPE